MTTERDRLNRTADLNRRLENAAPCPKCEIWFVDYWAKVAEKQAAERERDAALARVAALESTARALVDSTWPVDGDRYETAHETRLVAALRLALAPRSERREGACPACGGEGPISCHACGRSERREGEPATDDEVRDYPCECGGIFALDDDGCCQTCGVDWNYELTFWQDGYRQELKDFPPDAPPAAPREPKAPDPKAPERGALPCPVCDDGIQEKCPRCGREP